MKLKSLAKGLLATAALALAIVVAPVSSIKAEAAEGTYTVQENDYLKKIAKKVYGDENLWEVIYKANPVVKSNYIIYKGQVLIIPDINNNSTTTPTPDPTPAQTTPTPDPTPAQTTPTPAPTQQDEFVLDYDQIASWVSGGFVGINPTGETVILGIDAANEYAIIIFADDDTMTAASFVGPITYNNEYMTISDEVNGLALTYSVTELDDGELSFDMGELGVVTVNNVPRERVLSLIKLSIDGYTFIA